ncbi:GNAT family N-acetyltransferase [Sphingobacterium bovistauri]|uniref:GNAT family N-acetyltransferase n=1 Tax=Sphingobacterium bovistauri TaxID=2781959 RepID=A0ABS7Z276_9SPHI|nr:GNAT family protein [Sphingobacterium bovistauri]MCA5004083.1 GNAT family N-acetyltransferase [Sphingobacterium bovistauri]
MERLSTSRLDLVPISLDFCTQQYVSWLNDPEVYRYLETRGNYTLVELKEYLSSVIQGNVLMWAIVTKDSKRHIGNIKIDPINKLHGLAEYGILMGEKEEWGKGYAKEASQSVIDYCFGENLNLRKITLGVVKDNEVAVKLYENLGFRKEGLYEKHVVYDGKSYDIVRMAIFNPSVN